MRVRIPLGVLYYDPLYPAGCGVKINSSFTYIKTNNTDAVKVTSIIIEINRRPLSTYIIS